jgi:hypothetical protein
MKQNQCTREPTCRAISVVRIPNSNRRPFRQDPLMTLSTPQDYWYKNMYSVYNFKYNKQCETLFKSPAHLTGITANPPFLIAIPPFSPKLTLQTQGPIIIGLPQRSLFRPQHTLAEHRLSNTEAGLHLQVAPQGRFVVHGLEEVASLASPILISQNIIDFSKRIPPCSIALS